MAIVVSPEGDRRREARGNRTLEPPPFALSAGSICHCRIRQSQTSRRCWSERSASSPEIARYVDAGSLKTPESFVITNRGSTAVIAGADPRGVLFGVYGLLEKLGFGFYLSYTANPPARTGPFSFDGWELADRPLVATRLVFNWHNFLSGCSTWDLADWQNWIAQSARMRFNTIMVHAYGNNPMFAFTHNGLEKPTGYLSTTARGRDWGTEHVLDVRTMIGAAGLFDSPVFGARRRPGARRTNASSRHGAHAEGIPVRGRPWNGSYVCAGCRHGFRESAEHHLHPARERAVRCRGHPVGQSGDPGRLCLLSQPDRAVAPDLPADYSARRMVSRRKEQPLARVDAGRISPRDWRQEYERALQSRPDLRADADSPSMFAIGKIAAAYRKILDESGHKDVLPRGRKLAVRFPGRRGRVHAARHRSDSARLLVPVPERSGAGGHPCGKSPPAGHSHRLGAARRPQLCRKTVSAVPGICLAAAASGSPGYGIIHWTTRPLDLYFKSLADQVWSASENETLDTTCERMAERTFGAAARDTAKRYLLAWIQDAPQFGRETTDRFIDQYLARGAGARGVQPETPNPAHARTTSARLNRRKPGCSTSRIGNGSYSRSMKRRAHLQRSLGSIRKAEISNPRAARFLAARPEAAVEQYCANDRPRRRITGRERHSCFAQPALVAVLRRPTASAGHWNLCASALRPTTPEALAQSPGRFTYAFDANHRLWLVLGSAETGGDVQAGGDNTPCSGGLKVDHAISLALSGMGGRRFRLDRRESASKSRQASVWTCRTCRSTTGKLNLNLKPVNGPASVCGLSVDMSGRSAASHPAPQGAR